MFIGEAIVVHTFEFIEVIFDQSVKRRGFGTDRWFCESNLKIFLFLFCVRELSQPFRCAI
jgi:hypothetical protein